MNTTNDKGIIAALKTACPELNITDQPSVLESHGRDWTRFRKPAPTAVAFPETVEQVQKIVAVSAKNAIPLVPSGGRTGLSGGAVAAEGELVVSFDRMRRVLEFNEFDRTVTVEAGVVTSVVQELAINNGFYYPVSFASEGSSQIGGNIATNAGGIRVLRYGLTRERVLGVNSMDALMKVFGALRSSLDLTAFEFFTDKALDHVRRANDLPAPIETPCSLYVITEFDCRDEIQQERAMASFEHCLQQGWLLDGVISQSEKQAGQLWRYREGISESISHFPPYKNDLSVRISRVPEFLERMDLLISEICPDYEVVWYGHIGDGNLHMNILKPAGVSLEEFEARSHEISEQSYALTQEVGGSISAEHGIGLLKQPWLNRVRSEKEIELMKGVKNVFDPAGIFNPGKLL